MWVLLYRDENWLPIHGCKDIYRCVYKADSLKYSFSKLLSANSVFSSEILLVVAEMSVVSYLEQVINQNGC